MQDVGGSPASTTLPCRMTTTWSAMPDTTARSCETKTRAMPCSSRNRASRFRTAACTVTSSALVGSSARMTSARRATAIAMAKRCAWPPETWCG
ncbi:hypothetical protein ACFQY7_49890 [Actinomadura luteofluorescens]|uniref:hypothetical protein n=1 Tax=Actinomadura luteofluorescens TaxID=46163 RepID=UPI0036411F93